MPRQGVSVYFSKDVLARVQRLARDQNRSESSIIADAMKARLERGQQANPVDEGARRRLSRIDARLDKLVGESLVLKEIVLLFVRVWLEHNPPLDEAEEDSAAASADARFERFLDLVAQALGPGRSLAARDVTPSAANGGTAPAEQVEEAAP